MGLCKIPLPLRDFPVRLFGCRAKRQKARWLAWGVHIPSVRTVLGGGALAVCFALAASACGLRGALCKGGVSGQVCPGRWIRAGGIGRPSAGG